MDEKQQVSGANGMPGPGAGGPGGPGRQQLTPAQKAGRLTADAVLAAIAVALMLFRSMPLAIHQALGIALAVVLALHCIQHRTWFASLGKHRWVWPRGINIIFIALAGAAFLVMFVSGLMGAPGAAVHTASVNVGFCLLGVHSGLRLHRVLPDPAQGSRTAHIVFQVVFAAIAAYGVWAFIALFIAKMPAGTALLACRYAALFVLCTVIGHGICRLFGVKR